MCRKERFSSRISTSRLTLPFCPTCPTNAHFNTKSSMFYPRNWTEQHQPWHPRQALALHRGRIYVNWIESLVNLMSKPSLQALLTRKTTTTTKGHHLSLSKAAAAVLVIDLCTRLFQVPQTTLLAPVYLEVSSDLKVRIYIQELQWIIPLKKDIMQASFWPWTP